MTPLPKCKMCGGAKAISYPVCCGHYQGDETTGPICCDRPDEQQEQCGDCLATGLDLPIIRAAMAFKERADKANRFIAYVDEYSVDYDIDNNTGYLIFVRDLYPTTTTESE